MKKETGLMFKAPLVRAILAGQKTQTRRVVKPQPAPGQGMVNAAYCGHPNLWLRDGPCDEADPAYEWRCPMGKPGDRIYVRETWQHANFPLGPYDEGTTVFYRADYLDDPHGPDGEKSSEGKYRHWSPAIHMPKAAARIWLEITGVRVERLLSITEADLAREGIQEYIDKGVDHDGTPRDTFRKLWETTGGDWPANPWVWVIDFKTISTTGRPA